MAIPRAPELSRFCLQARFFSRLYGTTARFHQLTGKRRHICWCGAAFNVRFAMCWCMTMNTGLSRDELAGFANTGGESSGRPGKSAVKYLKSGFVWVAAVAIAGLGAWVLMSGYDSKPAESEPAHLATAIAPEPEPAPPPAADTGPKESFNPMTAEAITPEETAPVDGLKISSQSWRRGGLGSKALVTLTLRNGNDYAVKDIQLLCAFARRDGSHLTDRTRTIHDVVNMKSRKTFARMHIGFVNINADRAKCSLVAASHI
jgi:hypothetical protein